MPNTNFLFNADILTYMSIIADYDADDIADDADDIADDADDCTKIIHQM